MDYDLLFPQARRVLEEAVERHGRVWPFALEAIDMAHIAAERERDLGAAFVPGIPALRRVRNDINDDCWRYFRSITEPLIDEGLIREFTNEDGGELLILPDNLHVRLKKGNRDGSTSNVSTGKVCRKSDAASRYAFYPGATELDIYIEEGNWLDVVYVAGESMIEYTHTGLRFSMAKASPFVILDPPSQELLRSISPAAFDLVADARKKLAG